MKYRYFIEKIAQADSLGQFSVSPEVKDCAERLLKEWDIDRAKEFVLDILSGKFSGLVTYDVRTEANIIA